MRCIVDQRQRNEHQLEYRRVGDAQDIPGGRVATNINGSWWKDLKQAKFIKKNETKIKDTYIFEL